MGDVVTLMATCILEPQQPHILDPSSEEETNLIVSLLRWIGEEVAITILSIKCDEACPDEPYFRESDKDIIQSLGMEGC